MTIDSTDRIAWRTKAETVTEMTFASFRKELIHETPAIREFLDDKRGRKFVVSAPRGFGKTLLLIAKSLDVEERTGGRLTGAAGQIIDRPTGTFPNMSDDLIKRLKVDYAYWQNIWRIAIQAACIKHYFHKIGRPLKKGTLDCDPHIDAAICNPDIYFSACDFFVFIIQQTNQTQMKILQRPGAIGPSFNTISSQISLFIDDVEEYFKPALEDLTIKHPNVEQDDIGSLYYHSLSNEIWTIAQCALVGTATELNETNRHVKIYCSIRHEAFLKISEYDNRFQKIYGSTLQVEYGYDDYLDIFVKNINLLKSTELVEPDARDPIDRFFGSKCRRIRHQVMQTSQPVFDFILRHTLYRPRDLMMIGEAITDIPLKKRVSAGTLQRAVSQSSHAIFASVLAEMRPFFPIPNIDQLARLIPKNALTSQDIDVITASYLEPMGVESGTSALEHSPFCVLFRLGLLGTILRNFNEVLPYQHFRKPFEVTFEDGCALPPTEEYYLIHPSLDQFILDRSGIRYRHDFEARNIVGDGLPWAEPLKSYFVFKGDVCGFSDIMETDAYPLLIGRLETWAQNLAEDVYYYEIFGGDSVVFIDRNPFRLVNAVNRFLTSARQFTEQQISLRFGGSAGPLLFHKTNRRRDQDSYDIDVPMGLPLRYAARIEPLATPNTMIVDDAFRQRMLEMSNGDHQSDGLSFEPVKARSIGLDADENQRVMVRKGPTDPAYATHLWTLHTHNVG